jgi:hypothetical protein
LSSSQKAWSFWIASARGSGASEIRPDQTRVAQTAPPEVPLSPIRSKRPAYSGERTTESTPAVKAVWLPPP